MTWRLLQHHLLNALELLILTRRWLQPATLAMPSVGFNGMSECLGWANRGEMCCPDLG